MSRFKSFRLSTLLVVVTITCSVAAIDYKIAGDRIREEEAARKAREDFENLLAP